MSQVKVKYDYNDTNVELSFMPNHLVVSIRRPKANLTYIFDYEEFTRLIEKHVKKEGRV